MTNEKDESVRTCQDIRPEYELLPDMYSEEFHEFEVSNNRSIAELDSCKVLFIEEECSLCGKRANSLVVTGETPQKMQEYKHLIYDVYEAFYENPQSYGQTGFSGPVLRDRMSVHMEIMSTLDEVNRMARDDAESGVEKQSAQEIWAETLGPEYANDG
jgi:hypothetical protein